MRHCHARSRAHPAQPPGTLASLSLACLVFLHAVSAKPVANGHAAGGKANGKPRVADDSGVTS